MTDKLKLVPRDAATDHEYTQERLPWFANGTLDAAARGRVEAHLMTCPECHGDASRELGLFALFEPQGTVDRTPQAGLAAVQGRIDVRERRRAPLRALRAWLAGERGQRPLIFAVAIQALVIVMLTTVLAIDLRQPQPVYRTLTTPQAPLPAAGGAMLRVVFSGDLTLRALQELLAPRGLRIVAGPGERGIYTLAVDGSAAEAVTGLRADPRVRFAEIVGVP